MKPIGYLLALATLLPCSAPGQMPRIIAFQGVVTDTLGVPKPDGTYRIMFSLYDVGTGGSPAWSEEKLVNVKKGLLSTYLGDATPIGDNLRFDKPMWLGIALRPDPELSPRIQFGSVASSFFADSSRAAGTVADSSISSAKVRSGQVVRSLNGLHDAVIIRGQGGATVTSSNDTIFINAGSGGGGSGIQGVQNTDNTLDITNPNGPTATINVKAGGIGTRQIANNAIVPGQINTGGATAGQSLFFNGSSVLWGNPAGTLALPFAGSVSTAGTAISVTNTGGGPGIWGSAANDAVVGQSSSNAKSGVWGDNSGGGYGVAGSTGGASTAGVWGSNSAGGQGVKGTSIDGIGVYGQSSALLGTGVYGTNSGSGKAVYGYMNGIGTAGRFEVDNATGTNPGLYVSTNSKGVAGRFEISNTGNTNPALYVHTAGTGPAADLHGELMLYGNLTVATGNQVSLPFNSINSNEISNGAGLTHNLDTTTGAAWYINGTPGWIVGKNITAPSNGYAVVLFSCYVEIHHFNTYLTDVVFTLSPSQADLNSKYIWYIVHDWNEPDMLVRTPMTLYGVFPVHSGLNSFYCNAQWLYGHGDNSIIVYSPEITIMFVPRDYGGISPAIASGGLAASVEPGATTSLLASSSLSGPARPATEKPSAQNSPSVSVNVQQEIEQLRTQIEELKKEITATKSPH